MDINSDNQWKDRKFDFHIIKDLDYETFIASFINQEDSEQTIRNYIKLVNEIKADPIKSRPNPNSEFNPTGMISGIKSDFDKLKELYNELQLETYVKLDVYKDKLSDSDIQKDFENLITLIRHIKTLLKEEHSSELKKGWFGRITIKNESLIKLVRVDKLDKNNLPIKVKKTNIETTDKYEKMYNLVNNEKTAGKKSGYLPSQQIPFFVIKDKTLAYQTRSDEEDEVPIDDFAIHIKSSVKLEEGGKRKSRRKKSQRKGKRSIKKIKRKRSRKRY